MQPVSSEQESRIGIKDRNKEMESRIGIKIGIKDWNQRPGLRIRSSPLLQKSLQTFLFCRNIYLKLDLSEHIFESESVGITQILGSL